MIMDRYKLGFFVRTHLDCHYDIRMTFYGKDKRLEFHRENLNGVNQISLHFSSARSAELMRMCILLHALTYALRHFYCNKSCKNITARGSFFYSNCKEIQLPNLLWSKNLLHTWLSYFHNHPDLFNFQSPSCPKWQLSIILWISEKFSRGILKF